MKPYLTRHWSHVLIGMCGILMLAGCTRFTWVPDRYEYRYRVFQAGAPMPSTMQAPFSKDELTQRFLPAGAVNRSIELLAKDDFRLMRIEQVPDTGYYTFIFRRPIPWRQRPQRAPTEYTGVYQVQPPNDTTTYVALTPTYEGYTGVVFHGSEVPEVIEAKWDGEELKGQTGHIQHSFLVSGDGFAIVYVREDLSEKGFERKVLNARRVQTGQP